MVLSGAFISANSSESFEVRNSSKIQDMVVEMRFITGYNMEKVGLN